MSINFSDLFDACERAITLLRRLRPDDDRLPVNGQPRTAAELASLLATLGDFADDREIGDGPLCAVRARLCAPSTAGGDPDGDDFTAAVTAAVRRVERIRAAVHVEGHRRLRAAMLGL